jgi:hypothetical protein
MQPNNYILQESHDGITFIDSKDWLTNASIQYGTAAAQQHIYRYRELGITYYFRVKGTNGSANPIYSNIISKLSNDYAKSREMQNTGLGYAVGANGFNMWLAKDKIRHFIKQSTTNVQFAWWSGAKAGNFIYFPNAGSITGLVYKYDIINKTIVADFSFGEGYHRYLNYHQSTNSIYSIDYNGKLKKRDLTTNTTSTLVNYSTNDSYYHSLIVGNKLYATPGRFNNQLRIYDISTNTTVTKTIPVYNTTTSNNQYWILAHDNKIYLTPNNAGAMIEYNIATDTFATLATGLPGLESGTVSANGSKIYLPYINGTGIHEFNLIDGTNSKITIAIPGASKITLLENGKYAIHNESSNKGIVWDDSQTLTIDPMNPIYNY